MFQRDVLKLAVLFLCENTVCILEKSNEWSNTFLASSAVFQKDILLAVYFLCENMYPIDVKCGQVHFWQAVQCSKRCLKFAISFLCENMYPREVNCGHVHFPTFLNSNLF